VIEDGSHAELLGRSGLYARLWRRQSEGFLADETDDGDAVFAEPAATLDP
jgi:ATP-binding cassette subfamily B multidrug efflux pump